MEVPGIPTFRGLHARGPLPWRGVSSSQATVAGCDGARPRHLPPNGASTRPVFVGDARWMAEGEGFEPPRACAHTGFQDRRLQPLGHPSGANLTRRRPLAVQPITGGAGLVASAALPRIWGASRFYTRVTARRRRARGQKPRQRRHALGSSSAQVATRRPCQVGPSRTSAHSGFRRMSRRAAQTAWNVGMSASRHSKYVTKS